MKNKAILAIIMVAIMLAGCGKVDEKITAKAPVKKEETIVETEVEGIAEEVSQEEDERTIEELVTEVVEESTTETVPTEQVKSEEVQKTEQKKTQTKTETPAVTTPVVNEPVIATSESEVKKEECNHWYQPVETKNCASIKQMVWACNGCGYALFDISSTDYSPIILRSCTTFYVMAERCIQNESNFGPYEKVETGHAYIKSCDCGKNLMVSGEDGGMMLLKEQCCYCGDVKTYPEL